MKLRTKLTSLISMLTTASVVAPLLTVTSCSNSTKVFEDQFDKEYGVAEETYNDLEDQFINQYDAKLRLTIDDEDEINLRKDYLRKQLSSLDKMKDQRKNGFTSLTSAMMEFAKSKSVLDFDGTPYNIKLSRKTKATWAQIDSLFNSWKGSFRQYMLNSDMPAATITRVMQDAQNRFVSLKKELQLTCNDALDAVIQAKSRIITCFEGVNKEIALVAATIQLKEFMSQYVFDTKSGIDHPEACLDNLTNPDKEEYYAPDFVVGKVLSDKTMNQIFTITRKDDGKPIIFTNTLVKGYTIFPKLTKIESNNYTNTHTFSLDFGIVKTSYIGKCSNQELLDLTAHTYSANDYEFFANVDENLSLTDILHKLKPSYFEYPIFLSKQTEHNMLIDTYFNTNSEDGCVSFAWDNKTSKNQAKEAFYDNTKFVSEDVWESQKPLSMNSLVNSNLMIRSSLNDSYKFIKNIIDDQNANLDDVSFEKLDKKFLANCDLSANVLIDEASGHNTINIKNFFANYKNSIYVNDPYGKVELKNKKGYTIFQSQCKNFSVSPEFYYALTKQYNSVVNQVLLNDASILDSFKSKRNEENESIVEDLSKQADQHFFATTVCLGSGLITEGILLAQLWNPFAKVNHKTTAQKVVTTILFSSTIIGQIISYTLFMTLYYEPLQKHLDKVMEFQEYSKNSKIVNYLRDFSNYFVYIEKDGSYNTAEFTEKQKKFNKDFSVPKMLEQYRLFSNPHNIKDKSGTDIWKEYLDVASEKGVDPDTYLDKFKGYCVGGKYWIIEFSITIITLFISIGLAVWINNTEKAALEKEKLENELMSNYGEQVGEEVQNKIDNISNSLIYSFGAAIKNVGTITIENALPKILEAWENVVAEYEKDIWGNEDPTKRKERAQQMRYSINNRLGSTYHPLEDDSPFDIQLIQSIYFS